MAKKLDIKKIKEELDEFETLKEKKEYLEKLLKEIKDEKLKEQVEKLLDEINKLIEETEVKDTLEKTFTTEIPAPELPAPVKPEIEEIAPPIAPTPPPEEEEREPSPLEKYVRPTPTVEEERLVEPVTPMERYRMRIAYMPAVGQEAVEDVFEKYVREKHIRPEDVARSPQLQMQIAREAYEAMGHTTSLETIRGQVQYDAWKAAHPDWEFERDPEGWIKLKKYKGIKPELAEET